MSTKSWNLLRARVKIRTFFGGSVLAFCLVLHSPTATRLLLCSRLNGLKDRKYSLSNEIKVTITLATKLHFFFFDIVAKLIPQNLSQRNRYANICLCHTKCIYFRWFVFERKKIASKETKCLNRSKLPDYWKFLSYGNFLWGHGDIDKVSVGKRSIPKMTKGRFLLRLYKNHMLPYMVFRSWKLIYQFENK